MTHSTVTPQNMTDGHLSGFAEYSFTPTVVIWRKSTVCGLNGLRPLSASLGVPSI
jgi:hypothetical protein